MTIKQNASYRDDVNILIGVLSVQKINQVSLSTHYVLRSQSGEVLAHNF